MKYRRRQVVKVNPTQGRLEMFCILVGFLGSFAAVAYAKWNTEQRKKRQGCYYEDNLPDDLPELDRESFMAAAYKEEK